MGWREDRNATKSGPSSTRQRNAIEMALSMALSWRVDNGPLLNAGLVALWIFRGFGSRLLGNPIFCDFSGGSDPLSPLLDPPMNCHTFTAMGLGHMFSHSVNFCFLSHSFNSLHVGKCLKIFVAFLLMFFFKINFLKITFSKNTKWQTVWLHIRPDVFTIGPDLGPKCLQRLLAVKS